MYPAAYRSGMYDEFVDCDRSAVRKRNKKKKGREDGREKSQSGRVKQARLYLQVDHVCTLVRAQ